ncbi:MAG: alpha-E domain-containing protein [Myxococcota bacterium]|nr:alpha-E domain-containing protein [Myxococcota bacterium]
MTPLSPAEPPLLSRVADAVHWMNRYVERAENVARFIDVNLHLTLDSPWIAESDSPWAPLIAATGDTALFEQRHGAPTRENVMRFLVFDRTYPSSILSCMRGARENARSVREVISSEMWAQLNDMHLSLQEASRDPAAAFTSPGELFDRIKQGCHAFVGATYLTMTHNEAWHFGRLGRLLERADKTSRIVDVKCFLLRQLGARTPGAIDEIQWAALLKSASAFEMYRKRHGRITPEKVVAFLLIERKFPRSVLYTVAKAERSLHAITGTPGGTHRLPPEAALAALREHIAAADPRALLEDGLHEWIDSLQHDLNDVGNSIFEEFLAPRAVSSRERSSPPPSMSQSQSQSQSQS